MTISRKERLQEVVEIDLKNSNKTINFEEKY